MEKKTINFSFRALITKFQHAHREHLSPNMLWRTVVWGGFVGIIMMSIFAYLTYSWALSVESSTTPPRVSRYVFSLTELREIIEYYHQKETNFESLKARAPEAPDYQRRKGVVATSTTGLEIDGSEAVAVPTRTP